VVSITLGTYYYRRKINGKLVMDGFGVLKWPEGSVYQGQFANDKMCGRGRMTQANGDVY